MKNAINRATLNKAIIVISAILYVITFVEPFNHNGVGIIILAYILPVLGIVSIALSLITKQKILVILDILIIFAFPITWGLGFWFMK